MRLLVLVALLSVGCAHPLRTGVRLSVGCSMVAHGADVATSMYASGAGIGKELTTTLVPFFSQPVAFATVKMATAVAANYAVLRLADDHPKWALALGAGQCVGISAIAAHNANVIRKARP